MRVSLLAALFALQADRAERLYERVVFTPADASSDEARRVVKVLIAREHWVGAIRSIEEKITAFPDDLIVKVSFDWEGSEFAQATGTGSAGRIRFNLNRLEEYQKKLDDVSRQREEQAKLGRQLVFKVPPARLDRMIAHELTHVLQRGYEGPAWFNEGMAQWLGEDPNCVYAFAQAEKRLHDVDAPAGDANETYARGHLFWMWLASLGVARRTARATVVNRQDWKRALEDATGLPWDNVLKAERAWSAKEVEKYRSPK